MSRHKLLGFCFPKAGLTLQEFHDHYRHPHGTLGVLPATLRTYFQLHRIRHPLVDDSAEAPEAIAECYFDNLADVRSFRSEPQLVAHLIDDEKTFLDETRSRMVVVREEVVVSAPPFERPYSHADRLWSPAKAPNSVKLVHLVTRHGDPAWAKVLDGDMALALGALRYARSHTDADFHGERLKYYGAHELWWPTITTFERGVSSAPGIWRRLKAECGPSLPVLVHAERFI